MKKLLLSLLIIIIAVACTNSNLDDKVEIVPSAGEYVLNVDGGVFTQTFALNSVGTLRLKKDKIDVDGCSISDDNKYFRNSTITVRAASSSHCIVSFKLIYTSMFDEEVEFGYVYDLTFQ